MSSMDYSLCSNPGWLALCANCKRNPDNVPAQKIDPRWQSYTAPDVREGGKCGTYWERQK